MDIVCCEKHHFYDASQYASCPQCAAEAAGQAGYQTAPNPQAGYPDYQSYQTMPGAGYGPQGGMDAFPPTGTMDMVPPTEPAGMGGAGMASSGGVGPTMPIQDNGFTSGDLMNGGGYYSGGSGVQNYEGGTMPVTPGAAVGFDPVTGWLVSIEGPDRGTDYRIHANYNYIGRDDSNDICIKNDSHISHQRHAVIGYDARSKVFMFAPAAGKNIVRVNDRPVFNSVELTPYDVLEIGTTKLVFVPLCGDKFDWDR